MADPTKPLSAGPPDGGPSAGLGSTVVKGAVWTSLANVARIASAVLIIPILSRFLDLADFGIMQIAMPIVLFLMIFNDVGLGPALVRAENPSRAMWSSVLWTNLGLGLIMTCGLFAIAGPLADFFREPEVEPITQALSIALILNCLSIVPGARLQRDFKFKQMTIVEVVSISCGIAAAVVTAIQGAGAWALVYQQVAMFFVKTIMLWGFARNTAVAFEYRWSEIANVFGFSSNLLGTRFITFLANNVPNLLIGRIISVTALGAYSIAVRIMIVPVQIFAQGLTSVLLPTMAQFHTDTDRMRAACLRTYRLTALVTFPALAGIAALAEPFVLFALGESMAAAGPILALIAPLGAAKALLSSQSAMYMALGRADVLFKWATIEAVLISIGFAIGIQFGLIAAVQIYVVVLLLVALPSMKALLRLVDGTLVQLGRALWAPLVVSLAMTFVLRQAWQMDLAFMPADLLVRLLIFVVAGVVFYGIGLLAFDRKAFGEFRTIAAAVMSK
ncbi:MAG: lipopolysaccharide biosynthesis protein [Pseudomonadota bacterium]